MLKYILCSRYFVRVHVFSENENIKKNIEKIIKKLYYILHNIIFLLNKNYTYIINVAIPLYYLFILSHT